MFDYILEQEMGFAQTVEMNPQRMEKGKGIHIEENPSDLINRLCGMDRMFLVDQETMAGLAQSGIQDGYNLVIQEREGKGREGKGRENEVTGVDQCSKLRPYVVLTSDPKPRLRWTVQLHACFVNAIMQLGGPNKATPKGVIELMKVEGLGLHHVKSHLQKYRMGKCKVKDWPDQPRKRNARSVCSSSSSTSQANIGATYSKPRVTGTPRAEKIKEIQRRIYLQMEAERHLRRCRDAQRKYLELALESARRKLEAQHLGEASAFMGQDLTTTSTNTYPIFNQNQQIPYPTYNPRPICGSYSPYNTFEAVKAQLSAAQYRGSSHQPKNLACSVPEGVLAPNRIPEMRWGDNFPMEAEVGEEILQPTEEDPMEAYLNWEEIEALAMDIGLGFIHPFEFGGEI